MRKTLAASLLVLALAACATATPYAPVDGRFGYGEQKLESNRYRVWFAGNSATKRETVENYVLYRAAELTLDGGYDYFVLSERTTDDDTRQHGHGVSFGFGGFRFGHRSGIGIGIGTGTGRHDPEFYGQADIVLMKGRKPANNPAAFDAREIKANLEPTIVRPTPD